MVNVSEPHSIGVDCQSFLDPLKDLYKLLIYRGGKSFPKKGGNFLWNFQPKILIQVEDLGALDSKETFER
jgi:hypothetical protein